MTAGCDRCMRYYRGDYMQKPELFRTERLDADSHTELKQCRSCGTWWEFPPGSYPGIIDEAEAKRLIRDFGPKRGPSSFGEIED